MKKGVAPQFLQLSTGPPKWFQRRSPKTKKVHDNDEHGHRVIARVTITH